MAKKKREYLPPRVEVIGTFEKLTRANSSCPGWMDAVFPAGIDIDQVTLS